MTVTNATMLAACTTLCVFAAGANAAPIIVNADTTISSSASGDDGAAGPNDGIGFPGGAAVLWANTNVDVTILSGYTFTGGFGGLGGHDAANDGGNQGGSGADGFVMLEAGGTVTATNISVNSGLGGTGGDGGTAGANDTIGGKGGNSGYGISALNDGLQIILTDVTISAAYGGTGGAAGDAAGDTGDDTSGGAGGNGGIGIYVQGVGNMIDISGAVFGGDGGDGGVSLANAINASGGAAGEGIYDAGTNTVITIGAGSSVQGGDGGAAGTGGTGGAAGFDASGVWLQGAGTVLTNHGTILGSDNANSAAVAVFNTTLLIDNYGTIGAASGHTGLGIVIAGGTHAVLRNRAGALIQSTGNNRAIDLAVGSTVTNFVNEGSIINSGAGAALLINNTLGGFTNSGTIQSGLGPAVGIFSSADMPDIVDNTGGVITSSGAGAGTVIIFSNLGAAGVAFVGGQINNTGGFSAMHVGVSQTGAIGIESAAINGGVLFSAADETLNITGSSLNGDISFAVGNNNLNFFAGGTTTLLADTQLHNTTFFSLLAGSSVVSNAAQTDANSSIGKLTTIATSALTLNEDFWADDEVLNQGSIAIAAGKTLTSSVVNGDGVYAFGVTDAATVGRVVAQGAGSSIDFTGASLQIVLDNPADNFVNGTNFLLAEDLSNDAILGVSNGTLLTDNSALLSFYLYRGDAAEIGLTSDLLFAQVQLALLADIASLGDDPNAVAVGAALDTIGLDGNATLDDLLADLALLATNEEVNAVLDSLLPERDGVAYDIATDAGDQILDVASRRLDGLRGSATASLPYRVAGTGNAGLRGGLDRRGLEVWGQAFGRIVDQGRHDYNDGYDADGYGFAVGADTPFDGGRSLIGGTFAYGQTSADSNTINRTETDVDSYQLVVFGDHLFDNRVYAKGLLGYGWHQNDIARHDVGGPLGPTVTASYDARQFTARVESGRGYQDGANLTLVPHLTANYAHYDPDDYTETDPSAGDAIPAIGGLALDVKPKSLQSLRLGFGVLARWDIGLDADAHLFPELRLNYRRELIGDRFETTSEFLGAPGLASFDTRGVEPARDILNLGVGAVLATVSGFDVRASYDFELKESYTAHGGYLRASVAF